VCVAWHQRADYGSIGRVNDRQTSASAAVADVSGVVNATNLLSVESTSACTDRLVTPP